MNYYDPKQSYINYQSLMVCLDLIELLCKQLNDDCIEKQYAIKTIKELKIFEV